MTHHHAQRTAQKRREWRQQTGERGVKNAHLDNLPGFERESIAAESGARITQDWSDVRVAQFSENQARGSILKRFTPALISSPAETLAFCAGSVLRNVPFRLPRSRTRMVPSASGTTSKWRLDRSSSGERT